MKRVFVLLAVFCSAISLINSIAPARAQDADEAKVNDRKIEKGDLIVIEVFEEEDLSVSRRVQAGGTISYPLLLSVEVAGKTPSEVAADLRKGLGEKFLVNPQVSVDVKEYAARMVNVIGEVTKGGSFPLPAEERMTIPDAISAAGGFTPKANKGKIEFTRNGKTKTYSFDDLIKTVDKTKIIYLQPGDLINVKASFF